MQLSFSQNVCLNVNLLSSDLRSMIYTPWFSRSTLSIVGKVSSKCRPQFLLSLVTVPHLAVYHERLPFFGCPIHDFKAFPSFSPLAEKMIRRDTLDSICYSYAEGIIPIQRQVVAFILLSRPEKFQSKLEKNTISKAWSTIGRWDTRLGIKNVNVIG